MLTLKTLVTLILIYLAVCILAYAFAALCCRLFSRGGIPIPKAPGTETLPRKQSGGMKSILRGMLHGFVNYMLYKVSLVPSFWLRNLLYRKIFLVKARSRTVFYPKIEIRAPWNVKIGDSVVGSESKLDGRFGLSIGNHVNIGNSVCIWTEEHDVNDQWFRCDEKSGSVTVGDYAWLSSRSTVLPKVHIGEGAVLASGGITAHDLEEYTVYAGIPARKLSVRNKPLLYDNCAKRYYW